MNRIQELHEQGQSIWFDYIDRDLWKSGELAALIEAGVRGVTSNPSIFQQAITSSSAYEDDLQRLAGDDMTTTALFEALAITDIQNAADILRPVYDASHGRDGFVSLEVAPDLAYDTERTVADARRLHAAVNRPNLMIKVPATEQGVPAIRRLIADGLSINVTLIFAIERYIDVMKAYINGLEDRHSKGLPLDRVASVASFFVSRVDSSADSQLESLAGRDGDPSSTAKLLQGKIAVANAKLAYLEFQRTFSGPRWETLDAAGAQLQRPLWASTSTKNPDYPELLYVETLIGPHTVNTMPPKTLEVFRQKGEVARTIDVDVAQAVQDLVDLGKLGLSLKQITDDLEQDGVKKFAVAYDELLQSIEQRRNELVGAITK